MILTKKIMIILMLLLLVLNIFSVSVFSGSIGDNLRSDDVSLYMTMEDGVLPTCSFSAGTTVEIDANNTIEGVYCLNWSYVGISSSKTFYYFYDNSIKPSKWGIKVLIGNYDVTDEFYISLVDGDTEEFCKVSFTNTSGVKTVEVSSGSGTIVLFDNWDINVVYTISLYNIDWLNSVFSMVVSNSTSSNSSSGMSFVSSSCDNIYEMDLRSLVDTDFNIFVDDWTVGTSSNIRTGSISSITVNSGVVDGILVNDGSPLQNNSQNNHTTKVFYDSIKRAIVYNCNFNEYDTENEWSGGSNSNIIDGNNLLGKTILPSSVPVYQYLSLTNNTVSWNNSIDRTQPISKVAIQVYAVSLYDAWYYSKLYAQPVYRNQSNSSLLIEIPVIHFIGASTVYDYPWVTIPMDVYNWSNIENLTVNLVAYFSSMSGLITVAEVYLRIYAYNESDYTYTTSISDTIYSGSGFSKQLTGLSSGQVYYYNTFVNTSYTNSSSYFLGNESSFLTKPEAPTYTNYSILNPSTIRLNWTKGTGANNTIVVKNTINTPSNINDGTIVYNGTGTYTDEAITIAQTTYYRAWSYSNWSNPDHYQFSDNATNFTIGALFINCYDETNGSNLSFNVTIVNNTASQTYSASNCSNILQLNLSVLPSGDDVSILVGSYFHNQRIYYLDIFPNIFYLLDVYLPYTPIEVAPEGGNESELYVCQVINEIGQTLSDVHVMIYGLINNTNYSLIEDKYTDGNGRFSSWLLPGKLYKLNLSKNLYQTSVVDYIPQPPDDYGVTVGGIFKMYLEQWIPETPYYEPEHISFIGQRSNNTLFINYTDDLTNTTNTTIYVYEIGLDGVYTLLATISNTSENIIHYNITGVSANRSYVAILYYNHTNFDSQTHIVYMKGITPVSTWGITSKPGFRLNNFLVVLIGYNPFGWLNFLLFLFLMVGLYYADERNAGVIMALLGGIFLLLNMVLGFDSTLFTVAGGAIPILFIVIGVMYEWIRHKKRVMT